MTYNPLCGRTFEDIVEGLLSFMGYNTQTNTTLHTRPTHIRAEILHPKKGTQKLLIECKNYETPVSVHEVENFCAKVAFERENSQTDYGILVSNTDFSAEAVSWASRNCSFVQLRTYKQLILTSARFRKLLKKFHMCDSS